MNKQQFIEKVSNALYRNPEKKTDVTPDHWPSGYKLEIIAKIDHEYDPSDEFWGSWSWEKPNGIFGVRANGWLVDGDADVAAALRKAIGKNEPVYDPECVFPPNMGNQRIAYAYDPIAGQVYRYEARVPANRYSWQACQTDAYNMAGVYKIASLANTLDIHIGDGCYLIPLDASGPNDALKRAKAIYTRLCKFDDEYRADGKVISTDGFVCYHGDRAPYWQPGQTYDECEIEEQVKCLLQDWGDLDNYGIDKNAREVYIRITNPDGWTKDCSESGIYSENKSGADDMARDALYMLYKIFNPTSFSIVEEVNGD